MKNDSARRFSHDETAEVAECASLGTRLTPEFFELIYDADPEAENDDYYVTSPDFVQLHSQIKKGLVQAWVWCAVTLCFFMSGLVSVYI